jgi:hypothetical protein
VPQQERWARYTVARTGPTAAPQPLAGAAGQALLHWRPQAQGGYQLHSVLTQPGGRRTHIHSQGEWGDTGLRPRRLLHRRPQGAAQAASFLAEEGQIRFSSPRPALAHSEGVQDRLSWWLQLPAVVQAAPALQVAGARLRLRVVGSQGGSSTWDFECLGWDTPSLMGQPRRLLHWRRLPAAATGTTAELWLDPELGHWPVRVWLKPGRAQHGQLWILTQLEATPPE